MGQGECVKLNKIQKIAIILFIVFTIYVAFVYFDSLEKLKPIEKTQREISNCKKTDNSENCIYNLAIKKSDIGICEKTEMQEECIEDVQSIRDWSDCENFVHFRQIDACSIKFPEKFAKINCNSLEWGDLKDYCNLVQKS